MSTERAHLNTAGVDGSSQAAVPFGRVAIAVISDLATWVLRFCDGLHAGVSAFSAASLFTHPLHCSRKDNIGIRVATAAELPCGYGNAEVAPAERKRRS